MLSPLCFGGVNGDEALEVACARLVARVRGEGVRGIRPPAVLEENMPWWLFRGVDIDAVAIVRYFKVLEKLRQVND